MKRLMAVLLAMILLAGMLPVSASAATQYASVVGGWLRLRADASFEADTITSYYTDTVVEILGKTGNWYKVRTPDWRIGYMYGDYLKLGSIPESSVGSAYVTSHNGYGVRLRKGPGTGYRVIRTYDVGTPVTVLEKGSNWSKISINGTVGYMMSQFLYFGSSHTGDGNQTVLCYASIWSSNGYGVRLRTGPGKNYNKIGVYSVGTSVAVLEKGTTWDRIRVGSRTGWMMNEFLIYQNTNELTSVSLNTLHPAVGTVLKVKAKSPSAAEINYEWYVDGVLKSTNSTYTVASSDVNKHIQLKVTGKNGYSGSVWSSTTEKVISNTQINGLNLNTTVPVVGDIIKAEILPNGASVAYAWKVGGYQVSNAAEYTVTAADAGKVIELVVTGYGQYSGTLSKVTAAVASTSAITSVSIHNDSNTTVGAAPMVGDQLSAVAIPAQATAAYQWKRNGNAITDATGNVYTLTDSDLGAQISVTLTGYGAYTGEKTASIQEAVIARPVVPVIDDYALPDALVGQTYATQLTAQGGGQITWETTAGSLPDGLVLSSSGAITGTPVKDETCTFTVKATNAAGSAEKAFTLTVYPVAKPELTIGSVTLSTLEEGYMQPAPVSVSITNVGKADATLQQLWTEGTNGDCFVVNENGRSVIKANTTDTTWTVQPKAGLSAGSYTATFVAKYDDDRTASAAVNLIVTEKTVLPDPVKYTITMVNSSSNCSSAEAGQTIQITAGTLENKTFTGWTSEQVTFANASEAVTTFTMPESNVTVTANFTDASTEGGTETVVPVIDDYALRDALVGQTYATQLTAQGGGQITWETVAGSLPDGLVLSPTGAITGTPVKDETCTFTVKATNAAGSAEKTFTLTVYPVAKPELTIGSVTLSTLEEGYIQPAPVSVPITNVGKADATLQQLWTEGTNGDCFVVNKNGSSVIKANTTDTTWTVQPKAGLSVGSYTATFVAKYDDDRTASAAVNLIVTEKTVLPDPVKYTITMVNGSSNYSSAEAGETIQITAETLENKTFTGWTSEQVTFANASEAVTTFTMPEMNVTVTAGYTANAPETPAQYTVTVINGTANPSVALRGTTITVTANVADAGYQFSKWTSEDVTVESETQETTSFVMPEKNVTLTASFSELPPAVETKPVLSMQNVTIPSVEEGYSQVDTCSIAISNTGDGDASSVALSISGGSAESFSISGGNTTIGSGVDDTSWKITPVAGLIAGTYTAQIAASYNGETAYANVSFTVKEPAPILYQLTVENGSGSGTYPENASVNLSAAEPETGKEFDRWDASAGTISNPSNSETTFTMPAENATVTALYKAKEKTQLGKPAVIEWSEDGTSVSWSAVDGATGYEYYRVKVNGDTTVTDTTIETSYLFQASGQVGDEFFVRAIDSTGTHINGEFASAKYE